MSYIGETEKNIRRIQTPKDEDPLSEPRIYKGRTKEQRDADEKDDPVGSDQKSGDDFDI